MYLFKSLSFQKNSNNSNRYKKEHFQGITKKVNKKKRKGHKQKMETKKNLPQGQETKNMKHFLSSQTFFEGRFSNKNVVFVSFPLENLVSLQKWYFCLRFSRGKLTCPVGTG